MANDTPGSDAPFVGRADETTFSRRPDQPPADRDVTTGDARPSAGAQRSWREAADGRTWGPDPSGSWEAGPPAGGTGNGGGATGSGSWGAAPTPYGGSRRKDAASSGGAAGRGSGAAPTSAHPGASSSGAYPAGGSGGASRSGSSATAGSGGGAFAAGASGSGAYPAAGPGGGFPGGAYPAAGSGGSYPGGSASGAFGSTAAYATPGQPGSGPPTGQQPAIGWAGGPPPQRRGPGWGALIAVGVIAALLGGLIGALGSDLVGSGGSSGVLGAPIPDVESASAPVGPVEAVAARVLPSVVQLRVEGQGSAGEGSGIVLSADGLILTNNHVVEAAAGGGAVTVVYQDGQTAPARIVGLDPTSDLAVIRAEGRTDLTPAELGNSDAVRVGQQVVAFGSPLGLGGTVTSGIISAVDRAVSVGEESGASEATVLNALQTDAAINPGNSGGPLTDMEGRIIGINSVIATTGQQGGSIGVGFAIPVNQARRIASELEATGRATRAVLGVSLAPDDERSLSGAVVQSVVPGGAAELAGVRPGDVIVRFGDQRITNGIELQAAVRSHPPGEPVELQLVDRTIQVTPTAESG